MRRIRKWLFLFLSVAALSFALLFTGLAWLALVPSRAWRRLRHNPAPKGSR